jgi:hypothetical protein
VLRRLRLSRTVTPGEGAHEAENAVNRISWVVWQLLLFLEQGSETQKTEIPVD